MQTQDKMPSQNKILIVGGGIGGIRAAMDLAEAGRDVILIDKAFSIGGLMTQLDRTFPTNNCDLCTLSPHLSETGRQQHIDMMAMTQIVRVEGEVGSFTVTLAQAPRHIDLEKCTACGDCYRKFPECVRFSPGLDHRAPTCMRYPQATPHAYSIDLEKCSDIQALTQVCQANAIVPDQPEETKDVNVGAIILSPGASVFDPAKLDNFSYGVHPDVVTSLEYERILSASGPTQGELVRPSNGDQPKKIAWIQCVGSRGLQKGAASYCSSVCCMFSLKEAIVTKERFQQSIETTIFYMDMRTFGKDYEQYRDRAENEFGVQFVRSRPHSIIKDAETGDLKITFATDDDGALHSETFDMAVLSTGFYVSEDVCQMST
ncbi:FAD-dependent oxidoreductase, partial [Thermodesulfobacteriota bacterium]